MYQRPTRDARRAPPTGGVGTVHGTVTGLLIVRILPNIVNLLDLDPAGQQVTRGGVLRAVVLIQIPMIAADNARTAPNAHTTAPA